MMKVKQGVDKGNIMIYRPWCSRERLKMWNSWEKRRREKRMEKRGQNDKINMEVCGKGEGT